ncbi:MAG: hypothetical protein GWP08_00820 [Nitrospiraceae bacterium]|nr:hypothetical protein [Nitrospiraceae bacterium]
MGNARTPIFAVLALLMLWTTGCANLPALPRTQDLRVRAERAQGAVQSALDSMDLEMARAARQLEGMGLETPEARAILAKLCAGRPYVAGCATVDASGVIVAIEPATYAESEGANISEQEQVVRLRATGSPVLSGAFVAVAGFGAVDLQHPVRNAAGEIAGSLSMLIRPERFLAQVLGPYAKGDDWDCWVMQRDGMILYEPDPEEVGLNLFTSPLYRGFDELRALARRAAEEPEGSGRYDFFAEDFNFVKRKLCYWQTAGLHGTEWRVAVSQVVE